MVVSCNLTSEPNNFVADGFHYGAGVPNSCSSITNNVDDMQVISHYGTINNLCTSSLTQIGHVTCILIYLQQRLYWLNAYYANDCPVFSARKELASTFAIMENFELCATQKLHGINQIVINYKASNNEQHKLGCASPCSADHHKSILCVVHENQLIIYVVFVCRLKYHAARKASVFTRVDVN